jgi:HSP20 family molecular chaperone IbpA
MNTQETLTPTTGSAEPRRDNRPVFTPAADIYESPVGVVIRCDMPGVADSDLEITLENKVLTITGSQMGQGHEGCETLASEYETGVYQRSFALGRDIDDSAVKARLRDGVLEIELPKAKEARPRRIAVEA